jgi:hypothetical protein
LDHGGKAAGWNKTVGSLLELVADNLIPRKRSVLPAPKVLVA